MESQINNFDLFFNLLSKDTRNKVKKQEIKWETILFIHTYTHMYICILYFIYVCICVYMHIQRKDWYPKYINNPHKSNSRHS